MVTAGRRLGITTPKSRRQDEVLENRAVGRLSPDDGTSVSKKSEVSFPSSSMTATDIRELMNYKSDKAQARKTVGRLRSNVKRDAFDIHQTSPSRQREHTALPGVQDDVPHPQHKTSPSEKPLPSLPVATIRPTSPIVRRSLIDASERPLRKSLSSSPGTDVSEEWPAIQPSRPISLDTVRRLAQTNSADSTTTGMGQEQRQESLVKAQPSLKEKMECDKPIKAGDKGPIASASARLRAGLGAANELDTVLAKNEEPATEGSETQISAVVQDVSISATVVQCRAHSQRVPPDWRPRQTKTSMMRARLSSGSSNMPERENKYDGQAASLHQSSPTVDPPTASDGSIPKRLSIPGPVRSRSRSRRAVPTRNNPYGQRNRVNGRVVESHMNTSGLNASLDRSNPLSSDFGGFPNLMAVKQITDSGVSMRKSRIPTRNQSKDSNPEESEVDIPVKSSAKYVTCKDEDRSFEVAEDADIATDHKATSAHCKSTSQNSGIREAEKEETARELEAMKSRTLCSSPEPNGSNIATEAQAEIHPSTVTLSSTAFEENVSLSSRGPNNANVISLQEFAATELPNYRVKRLSLAAPEHGPILRIADDAEKVLLGDHSDEDDDVGEELRALKGNSASELWTATVLEEQFKVPKARISKGGFPLSQSTTSRSMSNLDTEQNLLTAAESCVSDARMNNTDDAVAGSESDDSRLRRRMRNEDPFGDESLVRGGHAGGHCPPKDQRCPSTCAEPPNPDLKTISERSSDEENSWISPLATPDAQNKEHAAIRTSDVPNNATATKIHGHREPSDVVPGLQTPMPAQIEKFEDSDSTNPAEGQRRQPFPARISSRKQFREMVQDRSDKGRPVPSRQSTDPQIPNRFAPVRSTNKLNVVSSPVAPVNHAQNIYRSDLNTTKIGSSSLQQRRAVDSAKAQLSTTKGMLSNIRGIFHKRSLENTDVALAMSNGGSVRRKNPVVGKSGSPFHLSSSAISSNPLLTGSFRTKPRLTPTPSGRGSEGATDSISPEFTTPDSTESQRAERLAMHVLDSALLETNAKKRAQLGQVSCKHQLLRCTIVCH